MSKSFRIAIVAACPFPAARGTPIRILRMSEAMAKRGHEVHVITYHLGDTLIDPGFEVHRIQDIPGYRKTSPGPTYRKLLQVDRMLYHKTREVLKFGKFDLIHAHHFEGLLVALAANRAFQLPIIFDIHTLLESELPYYKLALPKNLIVHISRALDTWLPRMASHVISVSKDIQAYLVDDLGFDPDRVSTIPNGVEDVLFNKIAPPNSKFSTNTLIFTGNLAPYQGIELMLEAFSDICKAWPGVRLQIVTDSSFDPYEDLSFRLGIRERIVLATATLAELPHMFAAADIALNPRTKCDGLPQKLLNYMAAGKPIVSFAGSAKYITHEESGLVVVDGDIDQFANAVLRLLDSPKLAQRLGVNARSFAKSELTWPRNAERTEQVYSRLTGS